MLTVWTVFKGLKTFYNLPTTTRHTLTYLCGDRRGRLRFGTVLAVVGSLHCIVLHCIALHLHCAALRCTARQCTAQHGTTLYGTALSFTALHCMALHYIP